MVMAVSLNNFAVEHLRGQICEEGILLNMDVITVITLIASIITIFTFVNGIFKK